MFRSLTLAVLAAALLATSAQASTPSIDRVPHRPDVVRSVAGFGSAHLPRCRGFSDAHVYSGATGRAYRQRSSAAGPYWTDSRGRAVAGFDRTNCDVIAFVRRSMIVAAWRDR